MSQVVDDCASSTLKSLNSKRAVLKGRITCVLKKVDSDETANILVLKYVIEGFLTEISNYDSEINELLCSNCDSEGNLDEGVVKELDGQTEYSMTIKTKLASLVEVSEHMGSASAIPVAEFAIKLPELKCEAFSGEGASNLQFHSFIAQFDNIVGCRTNISNSTKFTYLKSYLRGYALKLVQHLQVMEDNYEIALELLSKEFLNKVSHRGFAQKTTRS